MPVADSIGTVAARIHLNAGTGPDVAVREHSFGVPVVPGLEFGRGALAATVYADEIAAVADRARLDAKSADRNRVVSPNFRS